MTQKYRQDFGVAIPKNFLLLLQMWGNIGSSKNTKRRCGRDLDWSWPRDVISGLKSNVHRFRYSTSGSRKQRPIWNIRSLSSLSWKMKGMYFHPKRKNLGDLCFNDCWYYQWIFYDPVTQPLGHGLMMEGWGTRN